MEFRILFVFFFLSTSWKSLKLFSNDDCAILQQTNVQTSRQVNWHFYCEEFFTHTEFAYVISRRRVDDDDVGVENTKKKQKTELQESIKNNW